MIGVPNLIAAGGADGESLFPLGGLETFDFRSSYFALPLANHEPRPLALLAFLARLAARYAGP